MRSFWAAPRIMDFGQFRIIKHAQSVFSIVAQSDFNLIAALVTRIRSLFKGEQPALQKQRKGDSLEGETFLLERAHEQRWKENTYNFYSKKSRRDRIKLEQRLNKIYLKIALNILPPNF